MSTKKTSIGGQALIEGIMMKGPYKTAMAVRKEDGSIDLSEINEKHLRDRLGFFGLPLIRGMVNLIEAMIYGYKAMMLSAEISGFTDISEDEENPDAAALTGDSTKTGAAELQDPENTASDIKANDTQKDGKTDKDVKKESRIMGAVLVLASILGVVLAIVLFMYLPSLAYKGVAYMAGTDLRYWKGLIEGVIKTVIFVGYLAAVSASKDIKRVFMYHGAEHKTIFCYEKGEELTVENVRKFCRFHPRCGTSFLFLMLVVGILISSVLVIVLPNFIISRNYLWVPIKILLIPLTCGLGYELIRICGRHENLITRIIAAPGLWIQRLTTKEPDDGMIDIAVAALKDVIPNDGTDEIK